MMRLLIASLALVMLLAACGDGSSPAPSPKPTTPPTGPTGPLCDADSLVGDFAGTSGAAGHLFAVFSIENGGAIDCVLPDPPTLRAEGPTGDDLGFEIGASPCGTGNLACVHDEPVLLNAGSHADIALEVQNIAVLVPPCSTPVYDWRGITATFSEINADIETMMPEDIQLGSCAAQLSFVEFP